MIFTDCSSGFLCKVANCAVVGTLAVSAIAWDLRAPQMVYDLIHPHLAPEPWVQILPRRDRPDLRSDVSSDHAMLLEKTFEGLAES